MLQLYTFGGLRIESEGQPLQLPTQKARDLLAYLITFRARPHPRPVLADTLWPDLPEEKARRRLSDTLWRVRRVLGDHVMANDECVWLNTELPCWLDVEQFQNNADLEPQTCSLRPLEDALALYRGPFLDGFYHDWAFLERERLRGLYLEALTAVLEHHKQTGDYAAALTTTRRLVAAEPLHEAAHRELMRLYHLLGRDAEAVAQYHRCCEILREEMGVTPAPETEALYHTLSHRALPPPSTAAEHLPAPARRPVPELDALPLVGRDAERAMLLSHLEAAASGSGGIVLLEGEAGIGKSRLAEELVAGARWRKIASTVANAGETTTSSSYALLSAALTPLLTSLRVRQLTRLVEPTYVQAAAFLLPQIAEAIPDGSSLPDLPPAEARERLQQALVAAILGLARITAHLLVLEDIQWADVETLALLPLLLPHLTESRALVLLTGRSAELRATPAVWDTLQTLDRDAPFPRYALAPLDAGSIGQLVRQLLRADEPALTNHLFQESAGLPLYLVECLKAWRDEGRLLPGEDGAWRWCGDAPTSPPARLGEPVIGHRLSQLSSNAEAVLNIAAVIGPEVDFDLLASVCAFFESNLSDPEAYLLASDELLRLGFLAETDAGYRFSHEQVRKVVYHRFSPSQRQRMHHRVAQALEALYPEQSELLAHHFTTAGERGPAVHHLGRAAERARGLFAHQTAQACYTRLLDLLTHPDDWSARCDALRSRAEVLGWIGDREAQGRDLEEMLRLAQARSDDARLAEALRLRSEFHRTQGHYRPAERDALAALKIYRQLGDSHHLADLLSQLGWNVVYSADHPQASAYFQEALSIYQNLDDADGQIHCLTGLMSAAELDGDYSLSFSYSKRCMALAEATGDPRHLARAHLSLGLKHYDLGDLEAAHDHLTQALRLNQATGDRRRQAANRYYLGEVAVERNDFEAAEAHHRAALEMFREVQDLSWEGDALAALGRLALLQGDAAAAHEHLASAYQRRRELDEPAYAVPDLSYLALAELALGEEEIGWQHSQEAVVELEAGLEGAEHPYRVYYNHFSAAQATRHWTIARAALEKAAQIVDQWAERIDDAELRERFRTGFHVRQAIAEALAAQPPPGRLRVSLARADVPTHRRPTPKETVTLTWTVDAGEEDAALAQREGKIAVRRQRLLRLLAEAEAADALPTIADLAGALDVSPRTISGDLSALRRQGHTARILGYRA